jgi:hypothetical protein
MPGGSRPARISRGFCEGLLRGAAIVDAADELNRGVGCRAIEEMLCALPLENLMSDAK